MICRTIIKRKNSFTRTLGAGAFMKGETLRSTNGRVLRKGVGTMGYFELQRGRTIYGGRHIAQAGAMGGALTQLGVVRSPPTCYEDTNQGTTGQMMRQHAENLLPQTKKSGRGSSWKYAFSEKEMLHGDESDEFLRWRGRYQGGHVQKRKEVMNPIDADTFFDMFIDVNRCGE